MYVLFSKGPTTQQRPSVWKSPRQKLEVPGCCEQQTEKRQRGVSCPLSWEAGKRQCAVAALGKGKESLFTMCWQKTEHREHSEDICNYRLRQTDPMLCPLRGREGPTKSPLKTRHTMAPDLHHPSLQTATGEGAKRDTYTGEYPDAARNLPQAAHDLGSGFKPRLSSRFISSEPLGHRGWCSERASVQALSQASAQHASSHPACSLPVTLPGPALPPHRSRDPKFCEGRLHTELLSLHQESTTGHTQSCTHKCQESACTHTHTRMQEHMHENTHMYICTYGLTNVSQRMNV